MIKISAKSIAKKFISVEKKNPNMDFAKKWHRVKELHRSGYKNSWKDFEQSWKSAFGKAFEILATDQVVKILNKPEFKSYNVVVKRWVELTSGQKKELGVPLKRKYDNKRIFISNEPDIVIYKDGNSRAILSCKSSLRDRVSIDLLWTEVNTKENRKFLVVSAEPREKTLSEFLSTISQRCFY